MISSQRNRPSDWLDIVLPRSLATSLARLALSEVPHLPLQTSMHFFLFAIPVQRHS